MAMTMRNTAPQPVVRRKKEQRNDIWWNLLRQTREAQARRSRSHAVQQRELLVCGGYPADQDQFVQSLARPAQPVAPGRNKDQRPQKPLGQVRLSNQFAIGYGHLTLYSLQRQSVGALGAESEEAAKLQIHTLPEPDVAYVDVLRRVLERKVATADGDEVEEESHEPAVVVLLSWKKPWLFLDLLRKWIQLLARALLPPNAPQDDPLEVIRASGVSLNVIVQHVDAQEELGREGYNDECFDYISQSLRTCVLPVAASLVYTGNAPPQQPGSPLSELQKVIYTSMGMDLVPLSPIPAKGAATPAKRDDLAPKHNVVDRSAITVPSGWDSAGKIRLLSETFSPESLLEEWMHDLDFIPLVPKDVGPQATEGAAEGEADVFASTAEDEETPSQPSAIRTYEATVQDPHAHRAPKPPKIEVVTKPDQEFLAEMRTHLKSLEASDSNKKPVPPSGMYNPRGISSLSGEPNGALNGLGDVSFNVGGVSYNTATAEAVIERLKRAQGHEDGGMSPVSLSGSTGAGAATPTPKRDFLGTPRAASSHKDLPVEKLEEYFASLARKSPGTPSRQ
ncbi:hypothetical protein K470DRAFT_301388 [Piedraia hortae CBS 480.64]|uniref:Dynein light intermediate chain n=1 Tax=Piedraia hortae CBS 480.64 TaxID=1314780 RepID=A0A6A7BSE1_9PEZI|nr:hypothetical protein K470DRAFT_301388 [Piedraia hortae CBS 480.64]